MLYLLQAAKSLGKTWYWTTRALGNTCVGQGHDLFNRLVQRIRPVRSDLEEVSVGNVKETRVTEVVSGKWFLISFLNPANVRMLASWLGWVRLFQKLCHKGGKAIIFTAGNGHSPWSFHSGSEVCFYRIWIQWITAGISPFLNETDKRAHGLFVFSCI